jgi:protein-tyrosine sulfotransferase
MNMSGVEKLAQLDGGPIFVVGAARSGTTWVYDILTAHPAVAGAYETWLFTEKNGLGSLFTGAHWPTKPSGLGRLLGRDDLVVHVREFASSLLAHAVQPEHRHLIEKSPSHVYVMPMISEIFPNGRFIHVIRDGRDVSVSVRAAARSWMPGWRQSFGASIRSSSRAWRKAIRTARRDGAQFGDRYMEIRYEELRSAPEQGYARLFEFCGISCDQERLHRIIAATEFTGNFRPNERGFRRAARVGDWKTHFNLKDRLIFNRTAGDVLIDLGYERNRKWVW